MNLFFMDRTVVCNGDMREGKAHEVLEVLDKVFKRRRYLYSIFDGRILSWANESLKLTINERGISAQLTQTSPAVYNFPKAWLELIATKDVLQQPHETKAESDNSGYLDDEVKETLSPFWSTFNWAALDTSQSMTSLNISISDNQLQKMASPLHIKKSGQLEIGLKSGSTNGNKKRCQNVDDRVMEEAKEILGQYQMKRQRTLNI